MEEQEAPIQEQETPKEETPEAKPQPKAKAKAKREAPMADDAPATPGFDIMEVARQNADLTRQLEKAQAKLEKIQAEANSHKEELAKVRLDQRLGVISGSLASQMHLSKIAVDAIVRQYHGEVADLEDSQEAASKLAEILKAKDATLFRPVDVTGQGSLRAAPQLRVAGGYDPFAVRVGKKA